MKKLLVAGIILLMLTGCSQPQTLETVSDEVIQPEPAPKMQAVFNMPADAAQQTITDQENGTVYLCGDYVLTAHTTEGGDLKKTVLNTTGFDSDQLYMIETKQGDVKRYSFVWAAAGEEGEQVGRCVILDDGSYHYVLTAMADAEKAGVLSGEQWQDIFASFRLMHPQDVVSSGS